MNMPRARNLPAGADVIRRRQVSGSADGTNAHMKTSLPETNNRSVTSSLATMNSKSSGLELISTDPDFEGMVGRSPVILSHFPALCAYPTTASSIARDQSTLVDSMTRW